MKRKNLLKTGALAVGLSLGLSTSAVLAQDVTLRMSTWLPGQHHLVANTLPDWFAAIEEASGGTLKISIDPAPIAGPPAQYDVVRDGAADLSYHVMGYTPGPFEIVRGVELPFLSPNAEIGSQATYDWYDRNIGFEKEFRDVKVLTLFVHGPGCCAFQRADHDTGTTSRCEAARWRRRRSDVRSPRCDAGFDAGPRLL